MHFHRYRPHPELVMWDRCTKCGQDRIGARYHQQRYQTGGQVYTLYAKLPRVMPAGTRIQPPPPVNLPAAPANPLPRSISIVIKNPGWKID